ncbi:MAG: hypothetical protein DIU80_007435 [Chloroflexota bacterium]
MSSWFSNIAERIYREYDRRIRRASLVTEYGAHHDHDGSGAHHAGDTGLPPDEDVAIANLPRGATAVPQPAAGAEEHPPRGEDSLSLADLTIDPPPSRPQPAGTHTSPPDEDGEAEIVNLPPGG